MTNNFSRLVQLTTAIVISAALGACGGSAKSPVAPSGGTSAATPVPVPPTGVSTGASIDGTVVGMSGGQMFGARALGAGASISVMGTNVSSPIDASGHFSLRGVPSGDVRLQVTSTSSSAILMLTGVSDHEQIRMTIQVSGSSASTDDMDRETSDSRVEVEGRITAINGSSLTIAGRNVTVGTGTPVHHGSTAIQLSSLRVGDRVHVHGTSSGTGVSATDIEVETGGTPGDDHGNDQGEQEVSGAVSGRSAGSACPSISFTVGTTKVTTDASTKFDNTTCSALANGDTVEVKGKMQSNGTLLASSVDKSGGDNGGDHGNDAGDQELNGTVAGRSAASSCPAITFTVGTTKVATDAKTSFEDTSCTTLANGDKVQVKGSKQSSGTVLATKVEKE